VNTGTVSVEGKLAAFYTSHHYGVKLFKSKFIFTSCTANKLSRKLNYQEVSYVVKY
jgi:hypothetical protein